ncbi:MAG: tripartite tricarboxylate transporter substrate binding protein, partial [Beijerinckiaceae bacterium]
MITRRTFAGLASAALAAPAVITRAAAQAAYPHRTVTLMTHSSPGGGSDVFLREMSKFLGRQIA